MIPSRWSRCVECEERTRRPSDIIQYSCSFIYKAEFRSRCSCHVIHSYIVVVHKKRHQIRSTRYTLKDQHEERKLVFLLLLLRSGGGVIVVVVVVGWCCCAFFVDLFSLTTLFGSASPVQGPYKSVLFLSKIDVDGELCYYLCCSIMYDEYV